MSYSTYANNITEVKSADHIIDIVKNLPSEAIIFFDVDDTIITPVSKACRGKTSIIDAIKLEASKYKDFPKILSNWRLQRKIMLINR